MPGISWRSLRLTFSVMAVVALTSCHGEWRRYKSPVRLVLTAAFIAPGKESGKPWDGLGSLPPEVVEGLRAPRPRDMTENLFRALLSGTGMDVVARLLPWSANAFLSGVAAPDVQIEILVDGQLLQRSPMVGNSHQPTWGGVYTLPVQIRDTSQIEIHAIDRDIAFDDEIGVCTAQGMPLVDRQGYVSGQTWRCLGQLWGVALRIVPEDRHRKSTPATEISPKAIIEERD
jgi:hypothetical protein